MVESFGKTLSLDKSKIAPLGGVRELLAELEMRGALIGLVTGNLEPIAKMKMAKTGYSKEILKECGADFVFNDLRDTDSVLKIAGLA